MFLYCYMLFVEHSLATENWCFPIVQSSGNGITALGTLWLGFLFGTLRILLSRTICISSIEGKLFVYKPHFDHFSLNHWSTSMNAGSWMFKENVQRGIESLFAYDGEICTNNNNTKLWSVALFNTSNILRVWV